MKTLLKVLSGEFELIGDAGIDERKRFSLTKALAKLEQYFAEPFSLEGLHFRVYVNEAGQILLDPAVSVRVREMWLYKNPVALAKVREGLAQAAKGNLHDLGSFAKFADDEGRLMARQKAPLTMADAGRRRMASLSQAERKELSASGGRARTRNLTAEQLAEIGRKGADARWSKRRKRAK